MVTIIISSALFLSFRMENDPIYCLSFHFKLSIWNKYCSLLFFFIEIFIFLPPFFPFSRNDQLLIASSCIL